MKKTGKILNIFNVHHQFLFYQIYIESIISYGLLVYGSTNKNNLQPIFLIQKCIIQIIFKKSKFFHTAPLFENANILTVHEVFMMQLLPYARDNISAFSKSDKINTRSSKLDLFEQNASEPNYKVVNWTPI